MNAPMDEQRLAKILARATAATPGPWCTDAWEIYRGTEYMPGLSAWIGETCRGVSGVAELEQDCADAAFVAAARTDVPDLVAEVKRWRDRTEEAETAEAQLRGQVRGLRAHIDKLEMAIGTARAMHRKHSDSEHCQYDGMEWPCPNVIVLDGTVTDLAAAVDAMGALPMPTVGDLAEQRHLIDPQDHDFEHLADDRPTVVLPAQRDRRSSL